MHHPLLRESKDLSLGCDEYPIYSFLPPCFGQFLSFYHSNKLLIALLSNFVFFSINGANGANLSRLEDHSMNSSA